MRKFTSKAAFERYEKRQARKEEKAKAQAETTSKLSALARAKLSGKADTPAFSVTTAEPNTTPREATNIKPPVKRSGVKPTDRVRKITSPSHAKRVKTNRAKRRAS